MLFLATEDIDRVANSLISDFGESAEQEVERQISRCRAVDLHATAHTWHEIKYAIIGIRSHNSTHGSPDLSDCFPRYNQSNAARKG